jgi:ribonuclease HI
MVELDTQPVHPELDVLPPPDTKSAFIRTSLDGSPGEPVAHVHDATGLWLGTMTCSRLAHLQARWEQTRAHRSELFESLKAGSFEEEVAGLLLTWRKQAGKLQDSNIYRKWGAAPPALVTAVRDATGASTELFASPLDVHPDMTTYFSTEERDQLFGANVNAYSCRWAGPCFAHPPEDAAELEKAVRWALASAKEAGGHQPVLTVLLLPTSMDDAPYERWLQYPEVVTLARFGPNHILCDAASWQGASNRRAPRDNIGYQLVAIGNRAGRRDLLRPDFGTALDGLLPSLCQPAEAALLWPWARPKPYRGPDPLRYDMAAYNLEVQQHVARCQAAQPQLQAQYKAPVKLVSAASDTAQAWGMPAGWQLGERAVAELAASYGRQQYQMAYEWQDACFTDGSVASEAGVPKVGAAVWRAGQAWLIRTNGSGPDSTITRAELAAIYHALRDVLNASEEGLIFTDSLAAIHLIRRALRKPHTLERHLHKGILLDIARCLVDRANAGVRTRILKVKAHSGVIGNEEADKYAKEAGEPDTLHDLDTPTHLPFEGSWVPAFRKPSAAPGEGAGDELPRPVANNSKALAAELHASTKTGSSKEGVSVAAVRRMYAGQDGDKALGKESNGVVLGKGQPRQIRLRLLHLCGRFFNKSLARKWGVGYPVGGPPARDDSCPLCGGPDSCGHIQLSCTHPQITAMRIQRHDRTVRKIERWLRRHSRHGAAYTIMDACKTCQLEDLGVDGKRLPRFLLPEHLVSDTQLAKLRPDIVRILGLPPAPTPDDIAEAVANKEKYTVQVVEVGYCSDTKWRERVHDKVRQHASLMQLLEQAGWRVDKTPFVIVVGACGTVYQSGLQALQALGVPTTKGKALLAKIHGIAIGALQDISRARRRLERGRWTCRREGVG